ncbi:MFS transporter [Solirhodobacter olei]|uniref:MFS transporter n=1 Tax=Solirhodobacter olei TaxID=2493082 RepID=UPI000FD81BDA|nr:MFS transporter [Solirhodobacter olei]
MAPRYIPLLLKHADTPSISGFATLSGIEAAIRGLMISVMPLVVYDALGSASLESRLYFFVGCGSLTTGLMVPWLTRFIPRRWMYTAGTCSYMLGLSLAIHGGPTATSFALLFTVLGTATCFVCLNAYVLDYVPRIHLGRCQSQQMLYSATSWTLGPVLGVWLRSLWAPAPFILALCFAVLLVTAFWHLRLGNGKAISRAKAPAPNPLAYLGRFLAQPRLVLGWVFAVTRSCGWWVYVVYLPIFCVEHGLGERVGGFALSLSNAMLFTTPFLLRFIQRAGVRKAIRAAFLCAGTFFAAAAFAAPLPWGTVALLASGSIFLVLLDVSAGLPFLMAVKPSERTEMAAIYSSFRDVSGILTPGIAWLVLLAAPVSGVFLAAGCGLLTASALAANLHPRLGAARPSHGLPLRTIEPGE